MKKLTLTLSGMMAGWSTRVRGEYRLSDRVPSVSHVRGLLAACLGYSRDEDWALLDGLTYSIVGPSGDLETVRDYQTIQDAVDNNGKPGRNVVTTREYVVLPEVTVTISGDDKTLEEIEQALKTPVFQPYLGRRCCVPSRPLVGVSAA